MAGLATAQQVRWERALRERGDRYGPAASATARTALEALRETRAQELLELGAGQGRDTLFFARSGLRVTALDFAAAAIETIAAKCAGARLEGAVAAICHDVRRPLPFDDSAFDACYSHMLFCMALRGQELEALAAEIRRALRPGGLCVYTARATDDPDYGRGVHRGRASTSWTASSSTSSTGDSSIVSARDTRPSRSTASRRGRFHAGSGA